MLQPTQPRRLVRLWWIVRDGLPSLHRYRRYILAIAPALLLVWGLTFAYLAFAPVRYTSETTLILPGSGVGGSLNLNEIGQATAVTSSAFAGTTLSPTENYKRLLMADITLRRAAAALGEDGDTFPEPSALAAPCRVGVVIAEAQMGGPAAAAGSNLAPAVSIIRWVTANRPLSQSSHNLAA